MVRCQGILRLSRMVPVPVAVITLCSMCLASWTGEVPVCPADSTVQLTSRYSHWCLAADASGAVHVAWEDWRDGPDGIYYSSRVLGDGWAPESFRVSMGDEDYVGNPAICCDSEGNVFVAWREKRFPSPASQIYYRMYSTGAGWDSTDAMLDSDPPERESYAVSAAMDDSGNVHVVRVRDISPPWNRLLYKRYTPGEGWGANKAISVGVNGTSRHPVILEHGTHLHVVWSQYTVAEGTCIYYRKYSPSAGWDSTAMKVSTDETNTDPSLAIDAEGDLHVIWVVWFSDENREIAYRKRTADGDWDPIVSYVSEIDSVSSECPTISCDGTGNVHVVWQDWGSTTVLFERVLDKDAGWGDTASLAGGAWSAEQPHLVSDICGDLHLVWTDSRSCQPRLYYTRYDDGMSSVASREDAEIPALNGFASPNPCSGHTVIHYSIHAVGMPADVIVRICDVRGTLVSDFAHEKVPHSGVVTWDGRNRLGVPVAAGVYFFIAETPSQKDVTKIIVVK